MANVKITDLTAISAGDVAATDVFVVVDVNADATKKITVSDATTALAAANDFVTYTQLNSNLNTTTANVTAVEARRVANIAGAVSTVLTGDLTVSRALVSSGSGKTFTINQDCQSISLKLTSNNKIEINDISIEYRITRRRVT